MKKDSKKSDHKDNDMDINRDVEQFVALFDYATIGIILTDGKGRIINFNKYAERQFGYLKEEILGNTIEILLPESIHRKHVAFRKGFHQHAENREMGTGRDLYAKNRNGIEFPVEVSLSHYKLNNEEYVIAFVIDITLRKKSQDLVLQQKLELEQISQTSLSEILWQRLQNNISSLILLIALLKLFTEFTSLLIRCNTSLKAVFLPIPGKVANSFTAFSKRVEEKIIL